MIKFRKLYHCKCSYLSVSSTMKDTQDSNFHDEGGRMTCVPCSTSYYGWNLVDKVSSTIKDTQGSNFRKREGG